MFMVAPICFGLDQRLLCIHVKEPTKYPKSTDQISGGIWLVNETGFTGFEVDQYKHSFGHNSVDLQRRQSSSNTSKIHQNIR